MKNRVLLLLAVYTLSFACPAQAAFILKKKASFTEVTAASPKKEANEALETSAPGEAVKDAVDEFQNLPREERHERIREAKREVDLFRQSDNEQGDLQALLPIVITILLPPLAVGLYDHGLSGRFWLTVLLSLLFYIPGLVYAFMVTLH